MRSSRLAASAADAARAADQNAATAAAGSLPGAAVSGDSRLSPTCAAVTAAVNPCGAAKHTFQRANTTTF